MENQRDWIQAVAERILKGDRTDQREVQELIELVVSWVKPPFPCRWYLNNVSGFLCLQRVADGTCKFFKGGQCRPWFVSALREIAEKGGKAISVEVVQQVAVIWENDLQFPRTITVKKFKLRPITPEENRQAQEALEDIAVLKKMRAQRQKREKAEIGGRFGDNGRTNPGLSPASAAALPENSNMTALIGSVGSD